jgi:hypothetical protein
VLNWPDPFISQISGPFLHLGDYGCRMLNSYPVQFILKTRRFLKTKKKNCYIILKEVKKMTQSTNRLTNLQLELLKLFKYNLNQKQLLEVKDLLAKYFADKATREMDKLWEEKGLTDETMDSWLNEHMRTPAE